ncbi:hypothetical protein O181_015769 [Austropuccinia psidii MF-1]|uniref:Uncharacterized protein n=1 Tax=Austropuccinia psidii MF-1 TaxID=1389203 RepID=A0A9Q3C0H8_9BASI|nr:hypothetical protein [Austropuccinia psidii MF-1]
MNQAKVKQTLNWPPPRNPRLLNHSLALPTSTAISSRIIQRQSVDSSNSSRKIQFSPSMRKIFGIFNNSKRPSPPLQSFSTQHLFKKQEYSSQEACTPETSPNSK